MKLNFKQFTIPTGISGKESRTGDARESLADLIYMNVNGIRAHALAMKIYKSQGAEEYDRTEVSLIFPSCFLIDCATEKIIAKQLRGEALAQKLSELLD